MKKFALFLILPAFAFTLFGCGPKSQDDCGFVQNTYGERVSWKEDVPVTLYLHTSFPVKYEGALKAAVKVWEETKGRKLFNIVTDQRVTGEINPQQDHKNVIYYYTDTWEADKSTEQGRTAIYWVGDQMKEADVRINAKDYKFYWNDPEVVTALDTSSLVNIEALLIHELGHVLGLKHKDRDGSVMATYLANNTDRVNTAETDKASLQCEY